MAATLPPSTVNNAPVVFFISERARNAFATSSAKTSDFKRFPDIYSSSDKPLAAALFLIILWFKSPDLILSAFIPFDLILLIPSSNEICRISANKAAFEIP